MPAHKHPEEAEPDSHFEWVTPDEATRLEFTRDRMTVLQMASQWDLCISGDGLTHLQQIGEEAAFIPLAQVKPSLLFLLCCVSRASSVRSAGSTEAQAMHTRWHCLRMQLAPIHCTGALRAFLQSDDCLLSLMVVATVWSNGLCIVELYQICCLILCPNQFVFLACRFLPGFPQIRKSLCCEPSERRDGQPSCAAMAQTTSEP